jgi:hypothetical protein
MPRQARIIFPDFPHHVIQRGRLTASPQFEMAMSQRTGEWMGIRWPGRPRKKEKKAKK